MTLKALPWDFIIFVASLSGLIVSGQWIPYGWLAAASLQSVWITFGLITGQRWFIASGLLFAGFSYLNYRKARRILASK